MRQSAADATVDERSGDACGATLRIHCDGKQCCRQRQIDSFVLNRELILRSPVPGGYALTTAGDLAACDG